MGSYIYMSISYTRILIVVLFLGNALGGPLKDEPTEDFIVQCEEICEQCHGKGEPLEHNVCQCLVPRSLEKEDQICLSHMKENAKSLGIILKSIYVPSEMYMRHKRDVDNHMEQEEEDVCLKREPRKACGGIYKDSFGSGRLPLIVGQEREEVGNARNIENAEEVGQNIEFENAAENVGEPLSNDNVGAPLEEVGMEGNEETIGLPKFKKVIAVKKLKKKIKKQKKLLPLKKLAKIPVITHKLFGKAASKIDHLDITHGKGSHIIDKGLHTKIVPDIHKFSKSHGIKEKKDFDVSISISSIEIEKKDFPKNIHKQSLHGKHVLHSGTDIAAKKVLVHKLHKKPKFGKFLLGSPEVGAPAPVDTEDVGLAPKNEMVEIQNEFEDNTVGDEHKVGAAAKDSDTNVGAPPHIEDAVVGNPLESEIEADSIVGSKRITENHIVVQPPSTLIENFEHKSSHIHEIGDEIIIGDPAPENIE